MEIKIQLKDGSVLSICFGRVTKWYQCLDWFHITIEYYDNSKKPMEVTFARYIFGALREE